MYTSFPKDNEKCANQHDAVLDRKMYSYNYPKRRKKAQSITNQVCKAVQTLTRFHKTSANNKIDKLNKSPRNRREALPDEVTAADVALGTATANNDVPMSKVTAALNTMITKDKYIIMSRS